MRKPKYNFGTTAEILESYSGGFPGVWIDHPALPNLARYVARDEIAALRQRYGSLSEEAPALYRDWKWKFACCWHSRLDLSGPYIGRESRGDGVAWAVRAAGDQSRFNELSASDEIILDSSGAAGKWRQWLQATAMIWFGRGQSLPRTAKDRDQLKSPRRASAKAGAGSRRLTMADHITDERNRKCDSGASLPRTILRSLSDGVLLERVYRNGRDSLNFSDYRNYHSLEVILGGLPRWLYDQTREMKIRQAAEIICEEDLLTALWNGYGVVCASAMGVSRDGGSRGVEWLQEASGTWLRAMAVVGFDDRREYCNDTIVFWDGSPWGQWSTVEPHQFPGEFQPVPAGTCALTLDQSMRYAIGPGEAFALSGIDGFNPMRLVGHSKPEWAGR